MKYLFLVLPLMFLVACTFDGGGQIRALEQQQRETLLNLQSCQSQLDTYRTGNTSSDTSSNDSTQQEEQTPQEPAQPQYEEVEAYALSGDYRGVVCFEHEVEACGMSFSDCKDGFVYRCIKDAKYKVIKDQKLIE